MTIFSTRPQARRTAAGTLAASTVLSFGLVGAGGASLGVAVISTTAHAVEECLSGECDPADAAYARQAATGERDWPNLHRQSQGRRVAMVQRLLIDRGANLSVTGLYGPRTAAAVTRFQRSEQLDPTGRMSDETFEQLLPVLAEGARGAAVTALQRRLVQTDVFDVEVDGIFGTRTAQSVSFFQDRWDLERDEVVGPLTWFRLAWG